MTCRVFRFRALRHLLRMSPVSVEGLGWADRVVATPNAFAPPPTWSSNPYGVGVGVVGAGAAQSPGDCGGPAAGLPAPGATGGSAGGPAPSRLAAKSTPCLTRSAFCA